MKTIIFVRPHPRFRIYKQALALKRTGRYKLILIAREINPDFLSLFLKIFNKIMFYRLVKLKNKKLDRMLMESPIFDYLDEKKLAFLIRQEEPYIVHTMAEPNDVPMIVMKNAKAPVIFDGQDFTGISEGIENVPLKERKAEKYCFEYAAGIVHKGPKFEIDYYRQHGYKITCPELIYLDYCNENLFAPQNVKKLSDEDGELHFVFTGGISPTDKYKYIYYIPLAHKFAKQKIHFHIYPNPTQYADTRKFHKYFMLDKNEPYFHFHKPVQYRDLNKEIAKYDFGMIIHEKLQSKRWTFEKMEVGMSNKLFSYLESGLPVIVSDHVKAISDFVVKYEIGYSIRDDELHMIGNKIEEINYKGIVRNVFKTREQLSLSNQVSNLEAFYNEVYTYYSRKIK
ncbi:MAG: hypothetical protein JSV56_10070 [Methanomassiliicoccales archaeon]|nr:MAG: hypothetical protein JSV56_10070 [Methanomassiliicoccales archaeon]